MPPGVTPVHVQYMCRRLCVENNVYSSAQSLVTTQTLICSMFLRAVVYCCQQERNINLERGAGDKYHLDKTVKRFYYVPILLLKIIVKDQYKCQM